MILDITIVLVAGAIVSRCLGKPFPTVEQLREGMKGERK